MFKRTRTIPIQVYLTEEESALLDKKYKMSGKKSKSALIRQLIRDGFVFDIDFSEIQRYNYLLSNIANNVNQVAHRCNETRSVYRSDIDELKKEIDKIWQLQKSMLSMLPSEGQ
ncbi:MAG: MobC family plasmid mobilization relaxosome protein [Butyrivibrio sp.]|nr:MobC family plasmid mobilization relaxosome protein [Butyrivibrio sp.]